MKRLFRLFSVLLVLLAVVSLTSCAPANTEKAKAKMEKAGYSAVVVTFKEATEEGAIATVTCNPKDAGILGGLAGTTVFTLYNSSKNAKAAYNATKNAEGKTSAVLIGKWVAAGNEDIIKAFKK